jgi:hypothetical protein
LPQISQTCAIELLSPNYQKHFVEILILSGPERNSPGSVKEAPKSVLGQSDLN